MAFIACDWTWGQYFIKVWNRFGWNSPACNVRLNIWQLLMHLIILTNSLMVLKGQSEVVNWRRMDNPIMADRKRSKRQWSTQHYTESWRLRRKYLPKSFEENHQILHVRCTSYVKSCCLMIVITPLMRKLNKKKQQKTDTFSPFSDIQ